MAKTAEMTQHQKNAIRLIIVGVILLGAMIALAVSLGGCMAFKTMQINLTNDSSQIK